MSGKIVTAFFDGHVFKPEESLDLAPNVRYQIVVREIGPGATGTETAWDVLDQMAGTVDGPADWSAEHNHYLYGTPKQEDGPEK